MERRFGALQRGYQGGYFFSIISNTRVGQPYQIALHARIYPERGHSRHDCDCDCDCCGPEPLRQRVRFTFFVVIAVARWGGTRMCVMDNFGYLSLQSSTARRSEHAEPVCSDSAASLPSTHSADCSWFPSFMDARMHAFRLRRTWK